MVRCLSCAAKIAAGSRFCAACGAPVEPDGSATSASTVVIPARVSSDSSGSFDEGRFEAGTVLAGRYKIIALVGRGGMGEVYRANDLKLGQPVALKFLPERTAISPQALARFHNEVRIARQVSHPNVCRVYDIGETDGLVYISMEYVDGEDLGSLLRRIGRLPGDKALEIGRRLCAGLAAAHDKGVLHRDLKPGNVMIDGRGQVLITDFGLAAMAGQVDGGEIRNGTPAYMAPEQIAGKEVSVQSDLYSLGLVFYEMFTGKPAFQDRARGTTPPSVYSLVKDIDPTVERVVQRCLAEDPQHRPPSALAVAAALPGGDPLAAALAAGETPSPDAVAAAGDRETISVRAAVICMVCVMVGLIAAVVAGSQASLLRRTPFEKSGEELTAQARALLRQFGYSERPADFAFGFTVDEEYQDYAKRTQTAAAIRKLVAAGRPAPVLFWYRQSPNALVAESGDGIVTAHDPKEQAPGRQSVTLDLQGRLIHLLAVPAYTDDSSETPPRPADWSVLLEAAGLESARLTRQKPKLTFPTPFDSRAAWTGTFAQAPELPLRIEAASWKGRPAFFLVIQPWRESFFAAGQYVFPWQARVVMSLYMALTGAMLVIAIFLAARNYRMERVDGRGGFRLALVVIALSILEWLCLAKHHAAYTEYNSFVSALGAGLFASFVFGVLYMAVEPYVRRRWPQSIITWTRLLAGGVRDPLVGGHVLMGVVAGVAASVCFFAENLTLEPYGATKYGPIHLILTWAGGAGSMAGTLLNQTRFSVGAGLFVFLLFFLFRAASGRHWPGATVFAMLMGIVYSLVNANVLAGIAISAILTSIVLLLLTRYGVLALIAAITVMDILPSCPMTTDFSAWYSGSTLFVISVVLTLAGYAFYIALAGRPLFQAKFLED